MVPPFWLVMVPELLIISELVMVPELLIGLDTVTVIPSGIILSSAAAGTTPPLQVLPVFQSPLAAAVIVAACASGMANTDSVKIKANTER